MGIPIGQQSTATMRGRTCKVCSCEACREEYVYFVERTAVGHGSSLLFLDNEGARDRAAARAEKNLEKALDLAVDTVACPHCGWFQADMVATEKKSRLRWCLWASLPLSMIMMIVWVYLAGAKSKHAPTVILCAGVCAFAGLVLGITWRLKHDPNAGHLGVGTVCQERAVTSTGVPRKVFEAMVLAKQAKDDEYPYK